MALYFHCLIKHSDNFTLPHLELLYTVRNLNIHLKHLQRLSNLYKTDTTGKSAYFFNNLHHSDIMLLYQTELVLEFIFSHLLSTMQQYQDLKFNPFQIRQCTTCFGLLSHQRVLHVVQ
jgi:hypothetical protein